MTPKMSMSKSSEATCCITWRRGTTGAKQVTLNQGEDPGHPGGPRGVPGVLVSGRGCREAKILPSALEWPGRGRRGGAVVCKEEGRGALQGSGGLAIPSLFCGSRGPPSAHDWEGGKEREGEGGLG